MKKNYLQPDQKFVVTGGAGAIGSRLVRRLLDGGAKQVLVLDDLSSGYKWLLPEDPKCKFVKGDVAAILENGTACSGAIVFHLAAFFANQNSVDHPFDDLHTNGKGTLAALRWAAQGAAHRFVYASAGCSIAGHGIDAPIQEDMPVSLQLDTPYQITKALGEFYCNYFNSKVSTVRCRFFNSFGPGEVPGLYRNVIPNFIWKALHSKPLIITGTGNETRDFIFVDDLVDGLIASAYTPEAAGLAINLGTGAQTRIIDLANMIIEAASSTSRIDYVPRRAWDHSVRRQADIGRARNVLGINPSTDLRAGIRTTVQWFKDNYNQIEASVADTLI